MIKLTLGHLQLALFIAWVVGGLPTIAWLALIQFFPAVSYLQVFFPALLLYSLLLTFELARGAVSKGGN